MGMTELPAGLRPALRDFVKGTLGCGCEDRVFESVQTGTEGGVTEVRIGGRLLLRIVPADTPEAIASGLARWIGSGVAARDALAFNRVRLVLAAHDAGAARSWTDAALACIALPDERVHVHVVAAGSVPTLG